MHGNEVVGRELLIHLAMHLLQLNMVHGTSNFKKSWDVFCQSTDLFHILVKFQAGDSRVQNLLSKSDLYILPTMNPDGYANSKYKQCSGVTGRYTVGKTWAISEMQLNLIGFFNFKVAKIWTGTSPTTQNTIPGCNLDLACPPLTLAARRRLRTWWSGSLTMCLCSPPTFMMAQWWLTIHGTDTATETNGKVLVSIANSETRQKTWGFKYTGAWSNISRIIVQPDH